MEAEVTGDDNEASEAMPADEEPVREAKHYEDTGGNAEVFRPRNAAKGLTWLKCMWSRAWNAQGERLSDFQHALQEMPPPVLEEVAPRSLRRWLLRGGKWDFSLKPWPQLDTHVVASDAVLPKAKEAKEAKKPKAKAKAKTKKDKEAEDKKATSSWEATLAGARGIENPLAGKEQQWSTDFTAIVPLDADVIKHDCILESQAPDIRCLRGHKLLRKVVDDDGSDDSDDEGAQCSRCYQPIKAKDSYYICEPMADETKDTFCDERADVLQVPRQRAEGVLEGTHARRLCRKPTEGHACCAYGLCKSRRIEKGCQHDKANGGPLPKEPQAAALRVGQRDLR